ncbi:unnamed protein product [Fusarium fujikuroi]|uniref:Uncharacterized protein n=1 Tax=Fusarium fujikuroi TaxID=5127 RepID=A0A9Q9U6V6_FUSFU|nr:unnamed protein product [Fusarium fujikuroi]VZH90844.1 unnamed protein product [Fusarium fujikuroi]
MKRSFMYRSDDLYAACREEEDIGEDTDHHLSTEDPTIHVHDGEAIMKADVDEEDALNVADDGEANLE